MKLQQFIYNFGDDTTNKDDGIITFFTKPSGGSIAQRLIIQDDGDVTPGLIIQQI